MPSICVLDNLAAEGIELLKSDARIQFDVRTGLADTELRQALDQYDGVILRSGVKITAESLEGNTRLKAIVRAGVGTDNIDKQAATRRTTAGSESLQARSRTQASDHSATLRTARDCT